MQPRLVPVPNLAATGIVHHDFSVLCEPTPADFQCSAFHAVCQHGPSGDEIRHQVPINRPGVAIRPVNPVRRKSDTVLINLDHVLCGGLIRRVHHQQAPGVDLLPRRRIRAVQDHITSKPSGNQVCCIGDLPGHLIIGLCLGCLECLGQVDLLVHHRGRKCLHGGSQGYAALARIVQIELQPGQ